MTLIDNGLCDFTMLTVFWNISCSIPGSISQWSFWKTVSLPLFWVQLIHVRESGECKICHTLWAYAGLTNRAKLTSFSLFVKQ